MPHTVCTLYSNLISVPCSSEFENVAETVRTIYQSYGRPYLFFHPGLIINSLVNRTLQVLDPCVFSTYMSGRDVTRDDHVAKVHMYLGRKVKLCIAQSKAISTSKVITMQTLLALPILLSTFQVFRLWPQLFHRSNVFGSGHNFLTTPKLLSLPIILSTLHTRPRPSWVHLLFKLETLL